MRTTVAALSSLEESLFAARSVLNHAKDINQTLAQINARTLPTSVQSGRTRLLPISAVTRAKTLSQAHHQDYLDLVSSEAYNKIETLGELVQDHKERLDYHIFLIKERFQTAEANLQRKYNAQIEELKQKISDKKAELNSLYDSKDANPSIKTLLQSAKKELQELRGKSNERDVLTTQIEESCLRLQQLRDSGAERIEAFRLQLNELNREIKQNSICLDQNSVIKQITAILKACGASTHSLRVMKQIIVSGFRCHTSDFHTEFPNKSESAQQALKMTLAELHSLGLIHTPEDGVVAVGEPFAEM